MIWYLVKSSKFYLSLNLKMIIFVFAVEILHLIENSISEPLELLHIDHCGLFAVKILHHKTYILVIIDDYTRFIWVFFIRLKSETTCELINFIKGIGVLVKLPVRRIRSDNGSEFTNSTIEKFLTNKGIEHNFSAPYTPQKNSVVDRRNRTFFEFS